MPVHRHRSIWAAGAAAAVAASLIAAAVDLGPPSERRLRRLDERRVSHLRALANLVQMEWDKSGQLPAGVADVARQPWAGEVGRDPETAASYQYERIDERSYRLCATFARPSRQDPHREEDFWPHPAGRHCFELSIEENQSDPGERSPPPTE